MEEMHFRQFEREVIDRLARIETRLDQMKEEMSEEQDRAEKGSAGTSWRAAAVETIRILLAALLALIGIKISGGL
jgi:deoxyribose-phosphate aldolase